MRLARDSRGRWLPGLSPNPGGRPKGRTLRAEIEAKLAERPNKGARTTRLERIAQILVSKAEGGDLRALELILKRLWPEKLALEGDLALVVIKDFTGLDLKPGEPDERLVRKELPTVDIEPVKLLDEPGPEEAGQVDSEPQPKPDEAHESSEAEGQSEPEGFKIARPWEGRRPTHAEM